MTFLRGYQRDGRMQMTALWKEVRHILYVLPTGGGKTVVMGDVARSHDGYGCAIAHRSELVGQISMALAREGVRHDIMASKATIRTIVAKHMKEFGKTFYDPRAKWRVGSVDTIIRRDPAIDPWFKMVTLVLQDEAHHVLECNKWGRAMLMFPNARTLGVTATPERADGKGLGADASGIFEHMIEGPSMRWLIDNGYLTGYVIRGVQTKDLDLSHIDLTNGGEFNAHQVSEAMRNSRRIVGDVVAAYKKYAMGKLGITFAADIEEATKITAAYNAAGVPAALVTGEHTEEERREILGKFERREYLQLVNVDLFGEGFDLPAIEVVSMARPTASYGLYAQQFGRVLRIFITREQMQAWETYTPEQRKAIIAASSKPVGLVLDHVGNVIRHFGGPDQSRVWSLQDRERKSKPSNSIPMRTCLNEMCLQPYERFHPACPHCRLEPPPPLLRSSPEQVDGDITLYTEAMLNALYEAKRRIDGPALIPLNATPVVVNSVKKAHSERQQAQAALRQAMSLVLPPTGNERANNRRFFLKYGIDVLDAQTLGRPEAEYLRNKILESLQ